MNSVLIIGCGDIGLRVARRLRAKGVAVAGLVRSAKSRERLIATGITALPGDLDAPGSLATLPVTGAQVYYFAPPPNDGATDPRMQGWLQNLSLSDRPGRIVYISTTGVYGDCQGAWITEDRPAAPQTDRGRRRLHAENALREYSAATGVPVVILRVPGIYASDRLPVARLQKQLPVLRPDQSPYSNRIHADDLAEICIASMASGTPGAVYNVADNEPTTMSDYFNRVADYLGLPRPPAISLDEARETLTPAMLSFIDESRRIDNSKMRRELGVTLRYPDLNAGLGGTGT